MKDVSNMPIEADEKERERITFVIRKHLLNDAEKIGEYENRSRNNQLETLVADAIRSWKEKHPDVKL